MTDWREADELGYLSSWLPMVRDDDRLVGDFHGAFVPAVAESLVVRLTEPGDWVWDCMAGSGTTPRVCNYYNRSCFYSDIAPSAPDILCADARQPVFRDSRSGRPQLGVQWAEGRFDDFALAILHPPYHNIVKFSELPEDLSNCVSIAEFLKAFGEVCTNVGRHIKPGGYLGLVVGDVWVTRKQSAQTGDPYGLYPLAFKCMEVAMDSIPGSVLTAIQVKDIVGHARHRGKSTNLWKYRFYSWQSVSFDHEYIFSVRREGER